MKSLTEKRRTDSDRQETGKTGRQNVEGGLVNGLCLAGGPLRNVNLTTLRKKKTTTMQTKEFHYLAHRLAASCTCHLQEGQAKSSSSRSLLRFASAQQSTPPNCWLGYKSFRNPERMPHSMEPSLRTLPPKLQ